MELQELLEFLKIESPQDFQYFENMSDLMDSDYNIPSDVLFEIFSEVNSETATELIEEYFNDILLGVPEAETDIYSIIDTEKTVLIGLVANGEGERAVADFSEELVRFREWYVFDSKVSCSNPQTGDIEIETVRDALALYRAEGFGGVKYEYDFDSACNYDVDEYVVNVSNSYYDYDEDDEGSLVEEDEKESLIRSSFLYDDELKNS